MTAGRPNSRTDRSVGRATAANLAAEDFSFPRNDAIDRQVCRWNGLRNLFRRLWPAKASLELHFAAGCSVRHAERILSGKCGLSLEHAQALLHSEHGLPVLRELMRGCRERWWLDIEARLEIADLERRQAALRASLDQQERRR
ncbi:hypothetical protein CH340_11340 [Rhodoplanes serenus]|nr:hypothetical protein CH340_11340 [Rhodoplanes serenus]